MSFLVGLAMGIRVLKGPSSMKAPAVHASSKQTLQSSHSSYLTLDYDIIHLRERASLFLFGVRDPLHVCYSVENHPHRRARGVFGRC